MHSKSDLKEYVERVTNYIDKNLWEFRVSFHQKIIQSVFDSTKILNSN